MLLKVGSNGDDVKKLGELTGLGLKGCIIGRAIYDGRIDLARVIEQYG